MPPSSPAIEVRALRKTFGKTEALAAVDLTVAPGSVYGLLGPNGAGKTTAIRVLATLLKPTSGTARVLGHDVVTEAKDVRRKVSLTGQYASVDEDLTGHENLILIGRLLGLPRSDAKDRSMELLTAFGLADAAKRQVRTYSGGMRRRIDIAASLVTTPEILFLDEPTSGLDPRSRNQVWDIVRRIAQAGTTVLLTTQYLEEADRLAQRLAVLDHGKLIAEGTSRDLKASVGANALHVRLADAADRDRAQAIVVKVVGTGQMMSTDPTAVTATVARPDDAARVLDALAKAGVKVGEFSLGAPSLDDVFFALTGRPAEEKQENGENDHGKAAGGKGAGGNGAGGNGAGGAKASPAKAAKAPPTKVIDARDARPVSPPPGHEVQTGPAGAVRKAPAKGRKGGAA